MSDDGNIDVRITAQTDDFESATQKAAQSTTVLQTSFQELAADNERLYKNLQNSANAFKSTAAAATQLGASVTEASNRFKTAGKVEFISASELNAAGARITSLYQRATQAAQGIKTVMEGAFVSPSQIATLASRIGSMQSAAVAASSGIKVAMDGAFLSPQQLSSTINRINSIQTAATQAAQGIRVAMDGAFLSPSQIATLSSRINSFSSSAQASIRGIKTEIDGAFLSPSQLSGINSRINTLQNNAIIAAHGIKSEMDGAFVSPSQISALASRVNTLQSNAIKAAQGIKVAMDGAFLSPQQLGVIDARVQTMYSNATRAANGIKTAMEGAFVSPESLARLQRDFDKLGSTDPSSGLHLGATGLRELIVIAHEFITGNWSKIPGSLMALSERMSGLGSIAAAITPEIVAFGTAGAAALGALAYAGYQAYERFSAIRDVSGSLAVQGFGNQQGNASQEFDSIKDSTNLSNSAIKGLEEELDKLPAAAQSSRSALVQMAVSIAALKREDPAKVLEAFVSAARSGPEALAKLVTQTYGLEGGIKGTGQTLEEIVRTSTNLEQAFQRISQIAVDQKITKVGEETAKASNSILSYIFGLSALVDTGIDATQQLDQLANAIGKVSDPLKGAALDAYNLQGQLGALAAQAAAVTSGNAAYDKRVKSLKEVQDAQNAIDRLQGQTDELGKVRPVSDPEALKRAQDAQRNLQIAAQKEHTPAEEQDFSNAKQASELQLDLWKNDAQKRIQILQDAADKAKQYYGAGTPEAIAAQNRVTEAEQEAARKRVQITIDEAKDKAAEDRRGGEQRVAELQRAADLMRNAKGKEGEPLYNPEQIAAADKAVTNQRRLEQDRQYRDFKAERELEIQAAKGSVDTINNLYKQIEQKAVQTNQPTSESDSVEKQRVAAVQKAQAEQVSETLRFYAAQNQMGQAAIATEAARLKMEVLTHQISKAQEGEAEQAFTQKVFAEEEQRLQNALNTMNLTREQRIKLNEELAELYTKDAEKQIQEQEKITQAIEAENSKRAKSFEAVFDSAGSALEKFVTEGLTRSTTFAKASQQLFRSIVGSLTKEAGSAASSYAGKLLGPHLGLNDEQSKGGLGSVLGSSLMKELGLEKPVPKTGMEGVNDKLSLAAKAQDDAAKAMMQLVAALGKASPNGVPGTSKPTVGTGAPSDQQVSGTADSALQTALSYQGEKLKNYCATLVNNSLEAAGVKGSGSNLASSFGPNSNFGTPVDKSQVQKGDVFYSPPSSWGDTGHTGFTMGGVQDNGQVQVMSSHMQGDPNNPAGVEYRNANNLSFRRPDYGSAAASGNSQVKVDPASVAQGVQQGADNAAPTTASQIGQQVTQANQPLVDVNQAGNQDTTANTQAIDKSTQAATQLATKMQSSGSGSGGSTTGSGGLVSGTTGLLGAIGKFVPGAGQIGGFISSIQGAVNSIKTLSTAIPSTVTGISNLTNSLTPATSAASAVSSALTTTNTAVTATSSATTALQGANVINTAATTSNTAATLTNSAAQSGGGFGALGTVAAVAAFRGGGIVSAAGGMMVGADGQLAVLHNKEMVLPANISTGMQNLINGGGSSNNSGGNTLNYNANVTGYHPYQTGSQFDSLMRMHGSAMMNHVANAMRNGWKS